MTESGGGNAEEPTADEAAAVVTDAVEQGHVATLFGTCTVAYDGRTSRRLGPADRLVLCKPDGAVVVHDATGLQPVAYASPGASIEATAEEGDEASAEERNGEMSTENVFVVRAEREDPPETLVVEFESVARTAVVPVEDTGEATTAGPEARLRERLLDDPDLLEPGFRPLATERETPAGPVDVFGRDADGRTVVVEVKARRVGPDAVGQLARYVEALERDLHADATVRGVLVAPAVTGRARTQLAEHGLEFVPLSVG